ncbi:MAG: phosphatidylinositol-specific phospholipase C/glycerophosphodiester phosphodiesterase family protein [Verrucomicrobiales bacterium]
MVIRLVFYIVLSLTAQPCFAEEVIPIRQGHAHNDYEHERPLFDALDNGFCSIEVDIFLVGEEFLVGHDKKDLRPEKTIQSLYLNPLRERIRKNGGRVYERGAPLTLLIDIKSDGPETYSRLRTLLAQYSDILSGLDEGKWVQRAVTPVISGNRAKTLIAADDSRHAGIDGRISDLESSVPSHLMPLISDRWGSHFKWKGDGDFSKDERSKLHKIVRKAHQSGRMIRFWATPDRVSVWRELNEAGVDLINADNLSGLRQFLRP